MKSRFAQTGCPMITAVSSRLSWAVSLLLATTLQAQTLTPKQVAADRQAIRHALFIPDHLPAPAPILYGTFPVAPGVLASRVSYATEYNQRVPAIVYSPSPAPKVKLPGIVLVNGHGGDKSSWYAYYTAILYARAGAVVVTYDPIGSGETNDDRKPIADEHDQPIPTPATMPARMGGRMVADVMQAVSYLTSRKDIDPARIAVLGFSMGSFTASLAGGADPRIRALLLTGGGDLDGPGGYWDSSAKIMCQSGPWKALETLGDIPALLFTLRARAGETFIYNGTEDSVVDIRHHGPDFFAELHSRVAKLNGSEKGIFTTAFDPGASHRPNWMTPTDGAWLNQQLHFPLPLPTTSEPMRAWAERTGYPLGKSSGREDRDAGLPVLVAPVPLLTPDQLNALTPDQWQQQKSTFIYSTWKSNALAEATRP